MTVNGDDKTETTTTMTETFADGSTLCPFSSPQLKNVRVLGRQPDGALRADGSVARDPVSLTYTCSGIEFDFTGTSVWLETDADWSALEPWLAVELDGCLVSRLPVPRGKAEIAIFAGMSPHTDRSWHVRVLREVQPMREKREHLHLTGLRFEGGTFLPLPQKPLNLEFIGDSITTGEGAIGAVHDNDWSSVFFSGWNTYPRMVADDLGARFSVVSQSGWGISSSWDDHRSGRIPRIYTQVCGALTSPESVAEGMAGEFDFTRDSADAVIINLGTNDDGAFHQSPNGLTDPLTGEFYNARLQADGSYDPQSIALIRGEMLDFLHLVRAKNPDAIILWAFGSFPSPMTDVIRGVVDEFVRTTGDTRTFFVGLLKAEGDLIGSHEHPGVLWHRAAAHIIGNELRARLAHWRPQIALQ